ncbi:hypothetical protein DL98DRAFT_577699 [Cadophora sp. DSE1049]|nr:hypothetical protein DL98DRAFT_577699 [Cadophora sp. DSE1049]
MSNEHMQHSQCQTCFVHFPTNQELIQHIEEYRSEERLLVARLERCRLHLAQSYDIGRGEADDEDRDGEDDDHDGKDDDHEPTAPDQLQCPARGCKRVNPFTTRGNLVRHFQTHIQCYEMCPSCQEIFTQVDRFVRHDCKHRSDKPKDIYIQRRVAQFNSIVTKQLNMLQSPPSHTKRRAQGLADSVSTRAQKMVKTTQISVLPTNTSLQSLLSVACSMATEDESTSHSEPLKVTAANDTDGTFAKAAAMRHSNHTELTFPSQTTIDTPANDGGWALANSTIPTNDSGWAFAGTAPAMPANDSGWAFTETVPAMPANDSGWAFTKTTPAMPANDSGWAFAKTTPAMPANDSGWAFAETTPAMPANDSGWASAETVPAMPANDSGWASAETVPAMPPDDSGWAYAGTTIPTNDGGWPFHEAVG